MEGNRAWKAMQAKTLTDRFSEADDPRSVPDLERENIELKQDLIKQMITLENYLSLVYHLGYQDEKNQDG